MDRIEANQPTSALLFTQSEKLAQAADEFPECMKACDDAWGRHTEHLQ